MMASMRDSERLYRLLADNAVDVISLTTPEGRILYVSPSSERVLGIRPEEFVDQQTGLRVHAEDRAAFAAARARLMEGHETATALMRIQHGEGHWVWLEVALRAVRDEATGALLEIHALSRDVSERQRARDELALRAERLEALNQRLRDQDRYKDEFLSVMSHEMRTPLNAIMGFTALLGEQVVGPLTPEQQGFLRQVMSSADRMLVLVEDLLDQAKMLAGHFQVFPRPTRYACILDMAVRRVEDAAKAKGVTVAVAPFLDIAPRVDEARLVQMVGHLLANAVKFSLDGGRVDVRVRVVGDALMTEVVDAGLGISDAHQAMLFTRFMQLEDGLTRRTGGMGLGLSICKAIVDAHQGTIGVTSELGVGSTFWFKLPIEGPKAPEEEPA